MSHHAISSSCSLQVKLQATEIISWLHTLTEKGHGRKSEQSLKIVDLFSSGETRAIGMIAAKIGGRGQDAFWAFLQRKKSETRYSLSVSTKERLQHVTIQVHNSIYGGWSRNLNFK